MKYVIDASVALKWVLMEQDSDIALGLRLKFENRVHQLLAPEIFPIECGHALTRAERKGVLPAGTASVHLANILTTLPELHPALTLLHRACGIASTMRISLYDCLYVALAEREQCELITADGRLLNSLRPHFPFLVGIADL